MKKMEFLSLVVVILIAVILSGCCASAFCDEAIRQAQNLVPTQDQWLITKVFLLVSLGGVLGGFVYALETKDTHKIFCDGRTHDTGVWGHIFIGFCGGLVALAVILGIFGLDLTSITNSSSPQFTALKYTFYILAIGILGGYSGLPIISLISNAALKKVQQEVDQLKKDTEKEVESLKQAEERLQTTVKQFEEQLQQKNIELNKVTLQSILLTAESHARNGRFDEAIDLLTNNYLTVDNQEYKAYFWLALCEKRRGNLQKAIENIKESIKLKVSRVGYFNLACYLALANAPIGDVINALRLSWKEATTPQEQQTFKSNLRKDEDFVSVRHTPDFLAFANEIGVQLTDDSEGKQI